MSIKPQRGVLVLHATESSAPSPPVGAAGKSRRTTRCVILTQLIIPPRSLESMQLHILYAHEEIHVALRLYLHITTTALYNKDDTQCEIVACQANSNAYLSMPLWLLFYSYEEWLLMKKTILSRLRNQQPIIWLIANDEAAQRKSSIVHFKCAIGCSKNDNNCASNQWKCLDSITNIHLCS